MASHAQVTANRANAQLSTGPQTEPGKQQSSQNAVKHGFYSKSFLVRADEQEDFEHLRNYLAGLYKIDDILAYDLFHQLLHAAWHLHRIRRMENEIYLRCDNPFRDKETLAELDALRRHKGHFERVHARLQKSLKDHMTTYWTFSAFPPYVQEQVPQIIDTEALQRAHNQKWKLYRKEDFLDQTFSKEKLEKMFPKPKPKPPAGPII